jgi:HSP20 family protein
VPGVERSDLHVQVQLNKLLVTGLRRDGANGLKPVHVETTNGRFDRILPLPLGLDTESATAKLDRGVLNVKFQKNTRAAQRDIRVDVG